VLSVGRYQTRSPSQFMAWRLLSHGARTEQQPRIFGFALPLLIRQATVGTYIGSGTDNWRTNGEQITPDVANGRQASCSGHDTPSEYVTIRHHFSTYHTGRRPGQARGVWRCLFACRAEPRLAPVRRQREARDPLSNGRRPPKGTVKGGNNGCTTSGCHCCRQANPALGASPPEDLDK
jgi:hypothetical protein